MARRIISNDRSGTFSTQVFDPSSSSSSSVVRVIQRRTRPDPVQGDHKTPEAYYHIMSSLTGTQSSKSYTRFYDTVNKSYRLRLKSISSGPRVPSFNLPGGLPISVVKYTNPNIYPNIAFGGYYWQFKNLINQALSNLRDNKMEIGTELAESLETAGWLARRSRDLFSALLLIKSGKVFRGLDRLAGNPKSTRSNRVASAWLESQYAIKPLLYSIDDAMKVATEGLNSSLLVSGSAKRSFSGSETNFTSPNSALRVQKWNCNWSVDAKVKFTGRITDPELFAAKQLGLDNPYAIAWELVPFSFVVDWVLPIGDYLNAFQGPKGTEFLGGYRSIRARQYGRYSYLYDNVHTGTGTVSRTSESGTMRGDGYSRLKYTNYPDPTFPSFENNISGNNVLSALSLLKLLTS